MPGRYRVSFVADLPPLGYHTYRLVRRDQRVGQPELSASDTVLENERFRLEFDPQSGFIKSLRDKLRGLEVFAEPAARPVVIDDPSDTWSHNVFSFDRLIGEFRAVSVKLVEQGAVKAVIRVTSVYGSSELEQEFTLYSDLDQIDVAVTVNWNEHFKLLKLRFPVNVQFHKATCEIPYGSIERFANGEEEPAQNWVDLSGSSRDTGVVYGLSLLNDGKYSFDVRDSEIGMTILRSPIYAHHDPLIIDPNGHYSFIDQGIQRFHYAIYAHDGSWEDAGTARRAAELNQKPIALNATFHAGKLPLAKSFASIEPDNLILSVLKQAEDDDALIVRAYETAKISTHAKICVLDRIFEADFGAAEIKTFRLPRDPAQPVVETNLLEWTV